MVFAVFFFGLCVILIIFFVGKSLGPGGDAEKKKQLEKRLGLAVSEKHGKAVSVRKQSNLSHIDFLKKYLARQASAEVISLLLKSANLKVSVSFFCMASAGTGISVFLILSMMNIAPEITSLFGLLLSVLPFFYLKLMRKKYVKKFQTRLPDALGIMANVIKVGHGLESALEAVATSAPAPVCDEFRTIRTQLELGISLPNTLTDLYRRIGGAELKIFVTGISIHQELGGNLSEILENLQQTLRDRASLDREIKALSAQGIMSAGVMYCLPVFIASVWYFQSPELFKDFFFSDTGRKVIAVMVGLQIIAFFLMKKVINIKD